MVNVIIFLSGYNARFYECTLHPVHLLIPDNVSIRIGFNQSIKVTCQISLHKFCLISFLIIGILSSGLETNMVYLMKTNKINKDFISTNTLIKKRI